MTVCEGCQVKPLKVRRNSWFRCHRHLKSCLHGSRVIFGSLVYVVDIVEAHQLHGDKMTRKIQSCLENIMVLSPLLCPMNNTADSEFVQPFQRTYEGGPVSLVLKRPNNE